MENKNDCLDDYFLDGEDISELFAAPTPEEPTSTERLAQMRREKLERESDK